MRSRRARWQVGVAMAVLLAACGDAGIEVEDAEPDQVAAEPAEPDEAAVEPAEPDEAAVEPAEPDEAVAEPAEPIGPDAGASCDLAARSGATEVDQETYERAMLDANFELEILVMDLAAELEGYLAGVSDAGAYADQLRLLQDTWAEVTAPVRGLAPPAGAEPWHDRAIASFDRVCTTLADGLAGMEEDDEARAEAHVEAVQGFPSLLNELHANAACGPGESC